MRPLYCLLLAACASGPGFAFAQDSASADPRGWETSAQYTTVVQRHGAFRSPYSGPNSLLARESAKATTDITLFAGLHLTPTTELWFTPEIDQGFGLSSTLGLAGFSSGEAYKVGDTQPYVRLQRAYLRHTVAESGLVLTVGKFSVVDLFDTNAYAHDPRADFLNWSIIDTGPFDYAADAWGYTFGAAAEWTRGAWTWRGGVFQLSKVPNGKVAGLHLRQRMAVAEAEHRHELGGHPGKLKLLAFSNRAAMASYDDAVAAAATGAPPDVTAVRRMQTRAGIAANAEQELAKDVGVFARAGANDGRREAYEFTEINRSVAAGVSVKGSRWSRADDTAGFAVAANRLSRQARGYFAAGGMGILIGDGALNYAPERIAEAYYAARVSPHVTVSLDVQRIVHPAYNADRGPVTIFGLRLHAEM